LLLSIVYRRKVYTAAYRTEGPSNTGAKMEGKLDKPLGFWAVVVTKVPCTGGECVRVLCVSTYRGSSAVLALSPVSL